MDRVAVRTIRSAAEEEILRETFRRRVRLRPLLHALRPYDLLFAVGSHGGRAVGPDLRLAYLAEHARVEPLLHEANAFAGVALVAHLGADAVQARQPQQLPRFADGLRQRFLHIHVFAQHDGHVGRQEMHVVRRRDADRVDLVVHLEQHLPKIGVALRIRELRDQLLAVAAPTGGIQIPIHIAEGDDVLVLMRHDVREALAATPDLREADFGSGRDRPRLARILGQRRAAGEAEHRRGHCGKRDEVAAIHMI